jgi:hypothetical protein
MTSNKQYILFVAAALFSMYGHAQNTAINEDGSLPNPNAILDVKSFNKGILLPRVSTTGRLAIPNTKGMLVYDSTVGSFWFNTGTAWQNMAQAATIPSWALTGNGGTNRKTFLGTIDNKPLVIKVNNQLSGLVDPVTRNTFWGFNSGTFITPVLANDNTGLGSFSLHANTTGVYNTGIGNSSLRSNTSGSYNTAAGGFSMYTNTTGSNNVAMGDSSLYSNTTGNYNTAGGNGSLYSNTTASDNAAFGYHAMYLNTTGSENTALGLNAMYSNTTGSENTASGVYALYSNTSGYNNTTSGAYSMYSNTDGAINTAYGSNALYSNTIGSANTGGGSYSLYSNTTGGSNTAFGHAAGYHNTIGVDNTAVGYNALFLNVTGSRITAIGTSADVPWGSNLTNATAIGAGAIVNASNKVRVGNTLVTVIEGRVPFTTPSDGRFKYAVKEDVKGLAFIMQLRPVTYQFDVKRFDEQLHAGGSNAGNRQLVLKVHAPVVNTSMKDNYAAAAAIRRTGFIAQEVEKAAATAGYDFSGIIQPETAQDHYSLAYESFVVPLVKALQEQEQLIIKQDQQLASLQQIIYVNNGLSKKLPAMEQEVAALLALAKSLQNKKVAPLKH